jgi:hypothetical protein
MENRPDHVGSLGFQIVEKGRIRISENGVDAMASETVHNLSTGLQGDISLMRDSPSEHEDSGFRSSH